MKTILLTFLLLASLIPSAEAADMLPPEAAILETAPKAAETEPAPAWALCAGEVRREDVKSEFLGGAVTVQDPEIAEAELLRVPALSEIGGRVEKCEIRVRALKEGKTTLRLAGLTERDSIPLTVSACESAATVSLDLQVLELCETGERHSTLEPRARNFSAFSGDPSVVEADFRGSGRSIVLRGKKAGDAVVVLKAYRVERDRDGVPQLEPRTKKFLVKVAPCPGGRAVENFSLFAD